MSAEKQSLRLCNYLQRVMNQDMDNSILRILHLSALVIYDR